MKKIIVGILIIGVVAGVIFYMTRTHASPTVPSDTTPSQTQSIPVAPMVSEKSSGKYFTLDLSYPQSSSTEYGEMFAFIQKVKSDWLAQGNSITDQDAKDMSLDSERQYTYTMSTKVATSSKTVTYIISAYEFTGGAHGNTGVTTFTYDAQKKLVTLGDVFAKPYLDTVAQLSRTHFSAVLGNNAQKQMIEAGTEAHADNFSVWYLTDTSVVFIFGQYQVGPYVIGMPEYAIPKSSLSDILSPLFK